MTVHKKAKLRKATPIARPTELHPYAMVAGAFGLGFVLGGGLFTRLTARVAGLALRAGLMAALPQLKDDFMDGLMDVADRALGDDKGRRSPEAKESTQGRERTSP